MTVTLHKHKFTEDEITFFVNAVMNGVRPSDLIGCGMPKSLEAIAEDIDSLAMNYAEALPRKLAEHNKPDTSENRAALLELFLRSQHKPKAKATSKSYKRFATRRGRHV